MTNLELADKLQKEAEHFSGAQDIVGMLWDAGAALRNLHTENTALHVSEENLLAINAELVEALKHCIDWLNAAGINSDLPVQLQARAALAKAEGGEL